MYYQIQYLKHLLTATNQHGVHSPFVFNLVTKCLYPKVQHSGTKVQKILLKTISFFSVKEVKIDSNSPDMRHLIMKEFDLEAIENAPFDLIYVRIPKDDLLSSHLHEIHNNSLLFVDNIHTTKIHSTIWHGLTTDKRVTVSIDLFYCGLLFFRKEQVKEHFKIRI